MPPPGLDAASFDFRGRRVLVTGAAGGIGSAMARAFAAHGAALLLADRDAEGLERTAASLADGAETRVFDQADVESVRALAAWAGTLDVLLNNAGIVAYGPMQSQDAGTVARVVQTDLIGPMVLANAVATAMIARGRGIIVNTTSQLAFCGAPERAAYAAAKAGLAQFTRSAAAEWAPHGVRVVALAPGRTLTPLNAEQLATPEQRAVARRDIPADRLGEAAEMARLALVLASDVASYVVGHNLIADGGYVIAR